MKVIETTVPGCRFRSRLEARWAVFMPALRVPYVYEPEECNLGDGVCYAPDFWLSDQDCFLEIKPDRPTEKETEKAQRLATFTGKRVAVCFSPLEIEWTSYWEDSMYLLNCDKRSSGEYFSWYSCPGCHRLSLSGTRGEVDLP